MRGRRVWALTLGSALLASLMGCGGHQSQSGLSLWYTADLDQWDNATTALESVPYTGEQTVPALMEALLEGPEEDSKLVSPFPQGTDLQQWQQDGKRVTVDLSWPYGDLVGIELTMADYCITLTLTQLEGVEEVCITATGSQLPTKSP